MAVQELHQGTSVGAFGVVVVHRVIGKLHDIVDRGSCCFEACFEIAECKAGLLFWVRGYYSVDVGAYLAGGHDDLGWACGHGDVGVDGRDIADVWWIQGGHCAGRLGRVRHASILLPSVMEP